MKTYIALFRGINFGGNNIIPMRELVVLLENLGLQDVKTYIQSGNAVFRSKEKNTGKLSGQISAEIKKSRGFEPKVLILTFDEMEKAAGSNPFPKAESDHKSLHAFFLAAPPANPDLNRLESLRTGSERFELKGNVFYLHTPDGIGRSKLAANVERCLGVSITGRNWRTVQKIIEMTKKYI
jgi:uncharacterized protein (DUF1697 family)